MDPIILDPLWTLWKVMNNTKSRPYKATDVMEKENNCSTCSNGKDTLKVTILGSQQNKYRCQICSNNTIEGTSPKL